MGFVLVYIEVEMKYVSTGLLLFLVCNWMFGSSKEPRCGWNDVTLHLSWDIIGQATKENCQALQSWGYNPRTRAAAVSL